jgi:hypothetical protein
MALPVIGRKGNVSTVIDWGTHDFEHPKPINMNKIWRGVYRTSAFLRYKRQAFLVNYRGLGLTSSAFIFFEIRAYAFYQQETMSEQHLLLVIAK